MATTNELAIQAQMVLLQRIIDQGKDGAPPYMKALCEAYAWLVRPDQAHGGTDVQVKN